MSSVVPLDFSADPPITTYPKAEFIITSSGNVISRQAILCGSGNIKVDGKTIIKSNVTIRADMSVIKIGRYCVLHEDCVLRPPPRKFKGGVVYPTIQLGDYVSIGQDLIVCALSIGNCVQIGKNCIIGDRCFIKDCCRIEDGSSVPPDTVIPPYSIYSGIPAIHIGDLPEATNEMFALAATSSYHAFKPS